jgi:hypothetical protein
MKPARIVDVERVMLSLDGIEPADARLLAARLEDAVAAAIAARMSTPDGYPPGASAGDARQGPAAPLVTAARGEALVRAVAARLGDAIALQVELGPDDEEASWH